MPINVLTRLTAKGGFAIRAVSALPAPSLDELVVFDKRLWVGMSVDGIPAFVPLSLPIPHSIQTQALPSATWVVNHNLGISGMPRVFCYTEDGVPLAVLGTEVVSDDRVILTFASPGAGHAVVLFDTPSTLAGYGITDAYTRTEVDALVSAASGRGTVELDFGPAPGGNVATYVVTGQAEITAGARIRAWVGAGPTATHNGYEHMTVPLVVRGGDIVPGVGFTIMASGEFQLTGTFSVHWEWTQGD